MNEDLVQKLLGMFYKMTTEEQTVFFNAMVAYRSGERIYSVGNAFNETRFKDGAVCPFCGSIHFVKKGKSKSGHQRYLCRDCKKSFSLTTKTILAWSHNDTNVWRKYIECLFKGVSTKYLNNDLIWHNFENIAKETPAEKERILWEFIATNDCISRAYDMSKRDAVPLLVA